MLVKVTLLRPWWEPLIYDCDSHFVPENGARVLVPLGRAKCVGFVNDDSQKKILPKNVKVKNISQVLDNGKCVMPSDLWELALWLGKVYLCGTGLALKKILPEKFLAGENLHANPEVAASKNFRERDFFCPNDSEREEFLLRELACGKVLLLFALKDSASDFYERLPGNLRDEAIFLKPETSKKSWENWQRIYAGEFRIVIGSQSAVFAPFRPEKIIVEDEANPAYFFQRKPRISARTLAGKRALLLGCELILTGRMPSLKTYSRKYFGKNPDSNSRKYLPDRRFFVTVDSDYSFKESERGIDGEILLTYSLLERTNRELAAGHHVLWIWDRIGEAGEIFCERCGVSLVCEFCGGILRSVNGSLKCVSCGRKREFPDKCEHCGSEFLLGKRPGLEALLKIAAKYFDNVKLFSGRKLALSKPCVILGTSALLKFCDSHSISMIAWLNLDDELRRWGYDTRVNILRLIWDSYWRGRNCERTVLIQARGKNLNFASEILRGYGKFLEDELSTRSELSLPPFGISVEMLVNDANQREIISREFEEFGLFAMDDANGKLTVDAKDLSVVRRVLEKFFTMSEFAKNIQISEIRAE